MRATRATYDLIAGGYAERFGTEMDHQPLGREMLSLFAARVRAAGAGPVVDVGCGPGRATAHLHELGIDVTGVDLSPAMVTLARRAHPHLRFTEGTMAALDLADGALGGLVAWYSIIHTPATGLPAVFAEFHRVLAPGGQLLMAFQVGDEPRHFDEGFGHVVSIDFHRYRPERIAELLHDAGFVVSAQLVREPEGDETLPQAHLLARRPGAPDNLT